MLDFMYLIHTQIINIYIATSVTQGIHVNSYTLNIGFFAIYFSTLRQRFKEYGCYLKIMISSFSARKQYVCTEMLNEMGFHAYHATMLVKESVFHITKLEFFYTQLQVW